MTEQTAKLIEAIKALQTETDLEDVIDVRLALDAVISAFVAAFPDTGLQHRWKPSFELVVKRVAHRHPLPKEAIELAKRINALVELNVYTISLSPRDADKLRQHVETFCKGMLQFIEQQEQNAA